MEIIGYVTSLFIGISLGLIGGGGSVMTVPILVYLFHIEPVMATAYSLFIVGTTSASGAWQKWNKGEIDFRIVFIFGIPSLITVYVLRKFLIPIIPEIIYENGWFTVHKGTLTLILFSLLMIAAAIGMLHPQEIKRPSMPENAALLIMGIIVGIISGILGAGGGFIIIPVLMFYASLDIKTAIGTSLLIITMNSLLGFTGDLPHFSIDWGLLLSITGLGVVGSFIGHYLSGKIQASMIKKIFAWFILIVGLIMLTKELSNIP